MSLKQNLLQSTIAHTKECTDQWKGQSKEMKKYSRTEKNCRRESTYWNEQGKKLENREKNCRTEKKSEQSIEINAASWTEENIKEDDKKE